VPKHLAPVTEYNTVIDTEDIENNDTPCPNTWLLQTLAETNLHYRKAGSSLFRPFN
jgi:hypothetical protein